MVSCNRADKGSASQSAGKTQYSAEIGLWRENIAAKRISGLKPAKQ